ncbi:hypothetical protein BY996DRAFT_185146 [Phakopsora pachyrhizi]|uniref:Expressed protein n=1 Tax=Phakopsora pachyrhizi TaxID=170000 RepID=A0AAV0BAH3_PHAPC|nr:hypothetical protein BY996DRAFT_185146 [Phakopsora pachyrhizi]CAH7684067.1 expressed protein [Phakopsora pachyrhizi]
MCNHFATAPPAKKQILKISKTIIGSLQKTRKRARQLLRASQSLFSNISAALKVSTISKSSVSCIASKTNHYLQSSKSPTRTAYNISEPVPCKTSFNAIRNGRNNNQIPKSIGSVFQTSINKICKRQNSFINWSSSNINLGVIGFKSLKNYKGSQKIGGNQELKINVENDLHIKVSSPFQSPNFHKKTDQNNKESAQLQLRSLSKLISIPSSSSSRRSIIKKNLKGILSFNKKPYKKIHFENQWD